MTYQKEFEEFDKAVHKRDAFDCGKKELNIFLEKEAARHQRANISKTYVLPASGRSAEGKKEICSFYTITPGVIKREDLDNELSRKMPRYPIPVILIAQLAVRSKNQGQGLGKITLISALKRVVSIAEYLACYAVTVDCLDEEALAFYSKYGFKKLCTHNDRTRMYLPIDTVRQLFDSQGYSPDSIT